MTLRERHEIIEQEKSARERHEKYHGFRTVKKGGLSYCYECLEEKYGDKK